MMSEMLYNVQDFGDSLDHGFINSTIIPLYSGLLNRKDYPSQRVGSGFLFVQHGPGADIGEPQLFADSSVLPSSSTSAHQRISGQPPLWLNLGSPALGRTPAVRVMNPRAFRTSRSFSPAPRTLPRQKNLRIRKKASIERQHYRFDPSGPVHPSPPQLHEIPFEPAILHIPTINI